MTSQALAQAGQIAAIGPQLAKLKESSQQLEASFVKTLVSEMRKSMDKEFADVPGGDIYGDQIDQILADKLSTTGQFGIAQSIFGQVSKIALAEAETNQKTTSTTPNNQLKP